MDTRRALSRVSWLRRWGYRQSGDRPDFLSETALDYELTRDAIVGFRSDDVFPTLATIQVPSSSLSCVRDRIALHLGHGRSSMLKGCLLRAVLEPAPFMPTSMKPVAVAAPTAVSPP